MFEIGTFSVIQGQHTEGFALVRKGYMLIKGFSMMMGGGMLFFFVSVFFFFRVVRLASSRRMV